MMVKRFAAHYIFPLSRPPVSKGIVETDAEGRIVTLHRSEGNPEEMAGMIFYNGIICPAFSDPFTGSASGMLFDQFPFLQKFAEHIPSLYSADPGFEWVRAIQLSGDPTPLAELLFLFIHEPARILNRSDFGSIAPGKQPGLVLIDRIDYQQLRLSDKSRIKRLI